MANNNERDGVISSTPNMERLYANLRQVPVVLERTQNFAFSRADSNLQINAWSELANRRVGILTQRVYIQSKIPAGAEIVAKETPECCGTDCCGANMMLLFIRSASMKYSTCRKAWFVPDI